MTYPLEDTGFTLWHYNIEAHLKRVHGLTTKELGLDRRSLQDRYYAGDSVFAFLDRIATLIGAARVARVAQVA